MVIGKAASDSVVVGFGSSAGQSGVVVGSFASAGSNGVAIGRGAVADGGNVALGRGSIALSADATGSSYLTAKPFTNGTVVSVGNTNAETGQQSTRRIVNVEDGAQDNDAVNVGQLKSAQNAVANLVSGEIQASKTGVFTGYVIALKDDTGVIQEYKSVALALEAISTGEHGVALPSNAVTWTGGDRIAGLADAINPDEAVNLDQMQKAVVANAPTYFSINSSETDNKDNKGASGIDSIAIGPESTTNIQGKSSLAVGHMARTVGQESTALGFNTEAKGANSLVVGSDSETYHEGGIAIGWDAESHGLNSIAMGKGSRSHPKEAGVAPNNTIVIGTSAEATADNGIAIGQEAETTEARAIAQGFYAHSSADDAIAFGSNADADGESSQAFGTRAKATAENAQASGTDAQAFGYNSIATGTGAKSYATDGVAMGTGAIAGFDDKGFPDAERNTAGIAIGNQALADEEHALALGVAANARAKSSAAIGDGAEATAAAENGLAIGKKATVSAKDATAIGTGAEAEALNALAMGTGAEATAKAIDGVAIGTDARVDGESALAIGDGARADKSNALAFGTDASATGVNSSAIGFGANAQATGSLAFGTDAKALHEGSVALGSGSTTDKAVGTEYKEIDGNKYYYEAVDPTMTVSVGSEGAERTITNVAAGRVDEDSTDAINGSQLHGTNMALEALAGDLDTAGTSISNIFGGSFEYNPAKHEITGEFIVNEGNKFDNVTEALEYLGQGWNVSADGGESAAVLPGNTVDFGNTDDNILITREGLDLNFDLNKEINLTKDGSLQTGNTLVKDAGVTVGDGKFAPTTTVGAGNIVVGAAGGPDANSIMLNADLDGADITGLTNQTVGYTGFADGSGRAATEEQLSQVNTDLTAAGLNFVGNTGSPIHKNLGDTLSIVGGLAEGATASNANIRVDAVESGLLDDDDNPIHVLDIKLARELTDLDDIQVGAKDGADGTIGVNGADGSSVVLHGADGSIGLTGLPGEPGKDAPTTKISVSDGAPGLDGEPGTTTTRIVYTDGDEPQEVANLNDGMNFKGDSGDIISLSLNEQLNLTGGVKEADLTDRGNIGVVEFEDGLSIQLAKDLNVNSVIAGGTQIGPDGLNFVTVDDEGKVTVVENSPSITVTGIDGGDNQITSVASGLANPDGGDPIKLADATGDTLTNAANIGDLQNATNELTTAGLDFIDDDGNKVHRDLGQQLSITGGATGVLTKENIGVTRNDDEDGLIIELAKDIDLTDEGSLTIGDTVVNDKGLVVHDVTENPTASTIVEAGVIKVWANPEGPANTIVIDANTGMISGLSNTFFDPNAEYTGGFAATQEQLKSVSDVAQNANQGWNVSAQDGEAANVAPGAEVNFSNNDGNIAIVQDGTNLTFDLAADLNIDKSITIGGDENQTIINEGSITTNNVTTENLTVTGETKLGDHFHVTNDGDVHYDGPITEGTHIVNKEYVDGEVGKVAEVANKGWNIGSNGGETANVAPGANVDFSNDDGNIIITQDGTNLAFNLNDNLSIGGDGKDGSIGVKGADGKDGISINPDAIVFHGIDGIDGKDGSMTMATGAAGVDGKDGITRIQYTDPDGRDFEVATLDDGMKFVGDDGKVVERKLNETLSLTGGATGELSTGNIGVVQNGSGGLSVQLASELSGLESVTTNSINVGGGTMVVNPGSVTIAENTHVDMGGNRITNVAPGVDGTDAVNVNQLSAVAGSVNNLSRNLNRVDREARAGTASAAAMANLPQAYLPGKSMFAVAGAGHRGESGYAAGLSTISDNGKWVIKGSVAGNSRGDVTYGAGVGYQW